MPSPAAALSEGAVLAAAPGMPEWLSGERLAAAGIVVLMLVIFAETGLLIGFFLPGDSLLFTAGVLVAQDALDVSIWALVVLLPLAAIAGDQTGYTIGRVSGPRILDRPGSRIFRQEHVDRSYAFFERYGGRTIVLARFVPVARTVAPVIAGVSVMSRRVFTTYNVVGAVLWAAGLPLLGYYLGQLQVVADNVELALLGLAVLVGLPMLVELVRSRRSRGSAALSRPADAARD